MRLYLNSREASLIKVCLNMQYPYMTDDQKEQVERITDRIDLCNKLQDNEHKSKPA